MSCVNQPAILVPEKGVLNPEDVEDLPVRGQRLDEGGHDEVRLQALRVQGNQLKLTARVQREPVGRNVVAEWRDFAWWVRQAARETQPWHTQKTFAKSSGFTAFCQVAKLCDSGLQGIVFFCAATLLRIFSSRLHPLNSKRTN